MEERYNKAKIMMIKSQRVKPSRMGIAKKWFQSLNEMITNNKERALRAELRRSFKRLANSRIRSLISHQDSPGQRQCLSRKIVIKKRKAKNMIKWLIF